jgi:hypothetical protein
MKARSGRITGKPEATTSNRSYTWRFALPEKHENGARVLSPKDNCGSLDYARDDSDWVRDEVPLQVPRFADDHPTDEDQNPYPWGPGARTDSRDDTALYLDDGRLRRLGTLAGGSGGRAAADRLAEQGGFP